MPSNFQDTAPMTTRATDSEKPVHISREIPLWGILCGLGVFALQAVSLYYGQVSQGEKLIAVQQNVATISAKLDTIVTNQGQSNLKDLEHDLKITALQNRIAAIENVLQRQLPPNIANLGVPAPVIMDPQQQQYRRK